MSELSSETNPQILVNGKEQEEQQYDAAAAGEQISSISLEDECLQEGATAENETQAKVLAAFHQVRNQIKSQAKAPPKSSIAELVQRVRDRETESAQVKGEPEEKKEADMVTDESGEEVGVKQEDLCAVFEEKLEASKKALRDEFEQQISRARAELQAYTDQALKDLESKVQSQQPRNPQQPHPKELREGRGPDRNQRPSAPSSLASRRGRLLTRTMTTIIPKTCAPVIIGPRAKSETLSSSKGECSRLLLRDPVPSLQGSKTCQNRKPQPPICPPLQQQRRKPVRGKAKPVN